MNFIDQFKHALSIEGKAFAFLKEHGMLWTLLVPVVVFILLSIVGVMSIGELVHYFLDDLFASLLDDSPFWASAIVTASAFLLRLVFFVVFGIWGGFIVVIIMSPFLAYVSEKTECCMNGKEYPFDLIQLLKDVVRGVLLAIRNFFMEILLTILLMLISITVPVLGFLVTGTIGTVLLFCISAYYYGFSFIDYTNERRRLTVRKSVNSVKQNMGMAVGHGFIFTLLLYIPIVGPFLSAIYAVVSTVAATMDLVEDKTLQLPI